MLKLDAIPRFALPYSPGDLVAALEALCRSQTVSPAPFDALLGRGAKFWAGSGRTALWLVLKALRLPPGSGVATPLYNDLSVSTALVKAGYRPVFIDVSERSITMDPASLAAAAGKFSAVIAVHLFGNVADLRAIRRAAGPVPLIEDTVHAPLSRLDEHELGVSGVACFHSFASTKYWPAGGGGMLVVRDAELAVQVTAEAESLQRQSALSEWKNLAIQVAKAITFRRHLYGIIGLPNRSWVEKKAILEPELSHHRIQRHQAAVAIRQAARFRERVARQRQNSLYLLSLLHGVENVVLTAEWPGAEYNYHIFPVLVAGAEERAAIRAAMLARGVDTSQLYSNVIEHSRKLGYQRGCPVSESVADRLITLPNYASLSKADIERVARVFRDSLRLCRQRP
jgi:dTDP-4-amino-4,6-dideoxygalactose transaminase